MLIAGGCAETILDIQSSNLTFLSDGIVSGEGYFADHAHLKLPLGVEAKSSRHGSGMIYVKRQTLAQSENQIRQDDNSTCTDNDSPYNSMLYSGVWIKDDKRMAYAPIAMKIGQGYFANHPPTFRLPLKDEMWTIDGDDDSSIRNEVAYSHALEGELEASVEDYQSEDDDQALNAMNVEENVTSGMTHLEVVQDIDDGDDDAGGDDDDDDDDEGGLVFKMDETYSGTFQIALNATLPDDDGDDDDDDDDNEQDDYLPCCFGQSQNTASQDDGCSSSGAPFPEDNLTQELDLTVRGVGYFAAYRYLATPDDLEIEGSGKGSGAIEGEWQFTGQSDNDNCSLIACLNNNSPDCVQTDQSRMDFGEVTMSVGEGFYADHPVTYKSLLRDETSIKDNINANSMHHEVDYAHGLGKELGITVYDIGDDNDDSNNGNQEQEKCQSCCNGCMNDSAHICSGCRREGNNQGCNAASGQNDSDEVITIMNLSENVRDGKARTAFSLIGRCAAGEDGESETAGKCAAMRMDEAYVGTFRTVLNMTFTTPDADIDADEDDENDDDVGDEWLSICSFGYRNSSLYDHRGWRQDSIFGCD
jgi:hypothetical protein